MRHGTAYKEILKGKISKRLRYWVGPIAGLLAFFSGASAVSQGKPTLHGEVRSGLSSGKRTIIIAGGSTPLLMHTNYPVLLDRPSQMDASAPLA